MHNISDIYVKIIVYKSEIFSSVFWCISRNIFRGSPWGICLKSQGLVEIGRFQYVGCYCPLNIKFHFWIFLMISQVAWQKQLSCCLYHLITLPQAQKGCTPWPYIPLGMLHRRTTEFWVKSVLSLSQSIPFIEGEDDQIRKPIGMRE